MAGGSESSGGGAAVGFKLLAGPGGPGFTLPLAASALARGGSLGCWRRSDGLGLVWAAAAHWHAAAAHWHAGVQRLRAGAETRTRSAAPNTGKD
eukprot:3005464-Rhodomonas_salina.3